MKNKVFVIIPVHNRLEVTKKCLRSLGRQAYKPFEVILVDDGSTDGTSSFFAKRYPQWKTIKGTGNWWWTKSMHEGVKGALKTTKKGDFILAMNNDCFFKRNYLSNIVKTSANNKRAIVGSLILDAEKPTKVFDAGVRINWKNSLIYGVANMISDNIKFYSKRTIINKIDTLPGKGTLIPVEVFNKVGNFNYKRLPHYIGDYEFFCRAKKAGFKLIVSTKARLYNFVKRTGSSHISKSTAGYREVIHLMFGRKSKLNIIDHVNFLLLCCPPKYLPANLTEVVKKITNYALKTYPLHYILDVLHVIKLLKAKIKLALYVISLYIKQSIPRIINFLENILKSWKYSIRLKIAQSSKNDFRKSKK